MAALRPEQTPLKPLEENHARVKENVIFYYAHLLAGFVAAWIGRQLPFHASWLESYPAFITFAFILVNISILIPKLTVKVTGSNHAGTGTHVKTLIFSFLFTLLVGVILSLIEMVLASANGNYLYWQHNG